jgi:hypothetical protein
MSKPRLRVVERGDGRFEVQERIWIFWGYLDDFHSAERACSYMESRIEAERRERASEREVRVVAEWPPRSGR